MTTTREILASANVTSALIVDDAYDRRPLASDLRFDREEWSTLFDDFVDEDVKAIRSGFPLYDMMHPDELASDDQFVAFLWDAKENLAPELLARLFERYIADSADDQEYLASLSTRLTDLGFAVSTAGRNFSANVSAVDLVVIDLFLGSSQEEVAFATSVDGLSRAIGTRMDRPPLVVLMSRSPRLRSKSGEFRDRTGLLESSFRLIEKRDLAVDGRLERILTRLALHRADSLRLASFVHAWTTGVALAAERAALLIRRLDLADLSQIQKLLLSAEGEPVGSYLVDVLDLVLQHEIERDPHVIDAAVSLQVVDMEVYPPPYVGGSPDLQQLVFESLFQNQERMKLASASGKITEFGCVLRRRSMNSVTRQGADETTGDRFSEIDSSSVLAVLSPACDLQRQEAKRIILLKGDLVALTADSWAGNDSGARTAVFVIGGNDRYSIRWQLKHVETVSFSELERMLGSSGAFEVCGRLRTSHALEIQQKLLSSLGRVGLLAPLPATFHVNVSLWTVSGSREAIEVDVPELREKGGVCFVGKEGRKDMRLVLRESACDAICESLVEFDPERIHSDAVEVSRGVCSSGELLIALEKGVALPNPDSQTPKAIKSADGTRDLGFVIFRDKLPTQIPMNVVRAGGILLGIAYAGAEEES